MSCRDTRPLLPLFFDGELEARQMRAVALHSTRCPDCEGELRQLERLQDTVASQIAALVDDVDLGEIWAGVAPRLQARRPSVAGRLRTWWDDLDVGWTVRGPAFAAAAAAVLLTLAVWQRNDASPAADSATLAAAREVDNSAVLDSVQSSAEAVAWVTDAETNTTLLWIMDDGGGTVEQAVDQWEGLK